MTTREHSFVPRRKKEPETMSEIIMPGRTLRITDPATIEWGGDMHHTTFNLEPDTIITLSGPGATALVHAMEEHEARVREIVGDRSPPPIWPSHARDGG